MNYMFRISIFWILNQLLSKEHILFFNYSKYLECDETYLLKIKSVWL